jgi:hypothetical protein
MHINFLLENLKDRDRVGYLFANLRIKRELNKRHGEEEEDGILWLNIRTSFRP